VEESGVDEVGGDDDGDGDGRDDGRDEDVEEEDDEQVTYVAGQKVKVPASSPSSLLLLLLWFPPVPSESPTCSRLGTAMHLPLFAALLERMLGCGGGA